MRAVILVPILFGLSACAGPIAAWKGRAYGEHTIDPNELITMSSTFRNVRTARMATDGGAERTVACFEPHSEVAALMGGASELVYSGVTGKDTATPVLVKGHESVGVAQLAGLYHSISCNSWIDGVLTFAEYQTRTGKLLDAMEKAMIPQPTPAPK